jgi:asparagine synthase (glutamine-hydrolysing)
MCGIAGFIDPSVNTEEASSILESLCTAMRHRGPDGTGFALHAPAFLGHRRLSIIDVEGGAQPMSTPDERYTVTFNGEIYNFRELRRELESKGNSFHTRCDAEILPYLYAEHGPEMVHRLRGMFAFAVWDAQDEVLFAARDRVGIKPLYYGTGSGGRFGFASELPALMMLPWMADDVDEDAIGLYFLLGYVPEPASPFGAARKLPAGHTLRWQRGSVQITPYWDLPAVQESDAADLPEAEALEVLDTLLRDAVKARLISDVPLGAFLSGGIDSGLVVSYMAELSAEPVKTFSIGFAEERYSELKWARLAAERFATDHHELIVEPKALDLIHRLVGSFGEPFADSSAIPTFLVSEMTRRHVTVALSGDGGDEGFAGYTRYGKVHAVQMARRVPAPLARAAARFGQKLDRPWSRAMASMLERSVLPFPESYLAGVSQLPRIQQRGLFVNPERAVQQALALFGAAHCGGEGVRGAQYTDIKTYLVNDILTKVDRTSMAVSLEVRVPLLDHHILEWANPLPTRLKWRGTKGKYLLRKLAEKRLPAEHLSKPKTGFAIPLDEWFRGPLKELAAATLFDRDATYPRWLRRAAVETLWKRHQERVEGSCALLWSILFFELWWQRRRSARTRGEA